ncbi:MULTISPECIES: DUF3306 domain-containing protein [unclassified Hydrogenophaga]|uniref:DUF3306 domain-containing protein n=1 Tax=unclassified Hydrogenophaga TaxID=2610897 RepID=UPI000878ADA8|nr:MULTISPECIES: DUF3306 domain-containing protein [unclassified Hydrogenophaga]MBN9369778.1 DUF3306 domain-containing protein [Hydrogenophaga sp.]OJV69621.1 MAG: hypothetical protein BGO22_06790 [Hydrogenophaga sp. 70-12]
MADEGGGFLSRWSRRKQAVREGQALPPEPTAAPQAARVEPVPAAPGASALSAASTLPPADAPRETTPSPTLDDVARLTPEADFSRFVAPDVSSEVRNAAVKKLFADPHFNVMDGLDVYIDDYSLPSPLSKADMAQMVGARFLKLVDDPEEDRATAPASEPTPSGGPTAAIPGGPPADTPPTHDDHADLQLQPDHAPGPEGPGRGAG